MDFHKSLGVGLLLAAIGGLGAIAFKDHAAYQRLFSWLMGAWVFASLLYMAHESGYHSGKMAQWDSTNERKENHLVTGPHIPSWVAVLAACFIVVVFMLLGMTMVLDPPKADSAAQGQTATAGQHADAKAESK